MSELETEKARIRELESRLALAEGLAELRQHEIVEVRGRLSRVREECGAEIEQWKTAACASGAMEVKYVSRIEDLEAERESFVQTIAQLRADLQIASEEQRDQADRIAKLGAQLEEARPRGPGEHRPDCDWLTQKRDICTCDVIAHDADECDCCEVAISELGKVAVLETQLAEAEDRAMRTHNEVRLGYDKTVADCWRAKVAEVEARLAAVEKERDNERRMRVQAQDALRSERVGYDALAKRADAAEARVNERDASVADAERRAEHMMAERNATQAELEAVGKELAEAKSALRGSNDLMLRQRRRADEAEAKVRNGPTPEAYDAATRALWKHRDRSKVLETAIKDVIEQCEEGFVVCSRCEHEEPTHNLDIVADLRAALAPAAREPSIHAVNACNCAFKAPTIPTCRPPGVHLPDCPAASEKKAAVEKWLTKGDEPPGVLAWDRAASEKGYCPCLCHDMQGGPEHPNQPCVCKRDASEKSEPKPLASLDPEVVAAQIRVAREQAYAEERERCVQVVESGHHLHPEAPSAKWARQVAALIRAAPLASEVRGEEAPELIAQRVMQAREENARLKDLGFAPKPDAEEAKGEHDPVPEHVQSHGWQWRPVGDGAFAPPFGTIRVCDCGCLVAGGIARCLRCADAAKGGLK